MSSAAASPEPFEAVVIGAGPAGLATSRELTRRRVSHVVLERGASIGHTWANLYDSLVLHTGKHLSALPGMRFSPSTPLFPTRAHFLEYLHHYARTFALPVRTAAEAVSVVRTNGVWQVQTAPSGGFQARAVVMATGIVSNPYIPEFPNADRFAGRIVHSVEYRRPLGYQRQRVLVVGAGNSAGEISVELARAGASVTLAVRSGARVVPLTMLGVPIQYVAAPLSRLPLSAQRVIADAIAKASELARGPAVLPRPFDTNCPDVPLIGFHLVDAIRAGTIRVRTSGIAGFTPSGVCFADGTEEPFDIVMLATGYKAALAALGSRVRVDECGFALRRGRVLSADHPDLYYVGHNYDVRGGLRNIAIDARAVGKMIARRSNRSASLSGSQLPTPHSQPPR